MVGFKKRCDESSRKARTKNPSRKKKRKLVEQHDPYKDFTSRLKLLASKYPDLITTTLSNIFTMRLIGNKTHGDLAEIAIAVIV